MSQILCICMLLIITVHEAVAAQGQGGRGNKANPNHFPKLIFCENQCTGLHETCILVTGSVPVSPDWWECVVDCGILNAPTSGDVSFAGSLVTAGVFLVGSTVTYTCDRGYDLVGTIFRVCQSDGTWSDSAPTCNPVNCEGLEDPAYGTVSYAGTTFEYEATYSCSSGYVLVGDQTRTCKSDHYWSGSQPSCVPVDCGPLDDPCNGNVSIAPNTKLDSIATYSCNVGYILVGGNSSRTCQENAMWDGSMPCCDQVFPTISEDGERWRLFWWYENGTTWPTGETDVLGGAYGSCDPAAPYCFGRLPPELAEDGAEMLAKDSEGTIYRWAFSSTNPTAHAAWLAFHDHQQTAYNVVRHSDAWTPTVVAGTTPARTQDSFMYRMEHGVVSLLLDDDNCDCYSTLSFGHGMCFASFNPSYGTENSFGVDLLYENGCGSPASADGLWLYFQDDDDCIGVTCPAGQVCVDGIGAYACI